MSVRLFVRSSRISVTSGHASTEEKGEYNLAPEDSEAKDRLMREGINFETVDISQGIWPRIQAGLRRVTETPTLVDEGPPVRRFVGTIGIFEYIEDKREAYRRSAHRSTPRNWNV
jgi:hypothetical protein